MLVFPDPDPVDHRLRNVKPNQLSCSEHTPFGEPRVTQANLGKYLYPLPNVDGEFVIAKVPGPILDRWCNRMRENWVDQPGRDAFFMFDLYRKFYQAVPEADPRYKNRGSIFPRSFKYELDCFKSNRLSRLHAKMAYDEAVKLDPQVKKPFCICDEDEEQEAEDRPDPADAKRWQSRPKIFAKSQTDPCLRRAEFAKFRQPFRNEACNFYYKNFPMPKKAFVTKKFS